MATSKAKTVAEYLEELPADRRKTISTVRAVVRKHLPLGRPVELQLAQP